MHYGIFTYGTRGDVQPYIALALGLMEKGHQITLAAPENFKAFVEAYGILFHPLHGNLESAMNNHEKQANKNAGSQLKLTKFIFKILHEIRGPLRESYVEGFEKVDVIIANRATLPITFSLAEKMNKKIIYSYLMPPMIETSEFPAAHLELLNNRWYNKFSYRFYRFIVWQTIKKDTNEFRKILDLPILKKPMGHYLKERQAPTFFSISSQLIAQPKDWETRYEITGFISMPKQYRKQHSLDGISAYLETWLNAGEKPMYIGFGSMPFNPSLIKNILNDLLARTNHRIVFCTGWMELEELPVHPNLCVVKNVNHEWLLPRCKLAIIHGGAGTLTTVLKAMIPVIVVSIFFDQPTWGRIVSKKNIGVHLPMKKLTFERLMSAIKKTQCQEMITKTRQIGENINTENGLEKALEFIEKHTRRTE